MTKEKRMEVYDKYGGICAYCGKKITFKEMQVDHLFPKCLSHYLGKHTCYFEQSPNSRNLKNIDDIENLMPTCRRCNHYKRANTLEGYRKELKTLIDRCRKVYINKVAEDYGIYEYHEWNGKFAFEVYEENEKYFCKKE